MNFVGKSQPLLDQGVRSALSILGLQPDELPVLWAVLTVESRGFGFLVDRRPKILFERHIFFKEVGGRFAAAAPDLCAKTGGGYVGGAAEYARLERALALCRRDGLGDEPALRSASWGLGQVMGFNAAAAGFRDAADMVAQMRDSEAAQLAGMAGFIVDRKLDRKLRARDWAGFARGYNGPSFWQHQYDVKLQAAFDKFSSGVSRDLRIRAAQGALLFLGYKPGDPDGVSGQNTRNALRAFCRDAGIAETVELDDGLFKVILERAGLDPE